MLEGLKNRFIWGLEELWKTCSR